MNRLIQLLFWYKKLFNISNITIIQQNFNNDWNLNLNFTFKITNNKWNTDENKPIILWNFIYNILSIQRKK